MKIRRLDPGGIQPPELTGIRELESGLPDDWFGYSNMMIRFGRRDVSYEIDVVFVTHDRVFILDLKDWLGRVESRDGIWYQNGEHREKSAARKVAMLAKKLHGLMQKDLALGDIPSVEQRVVFTRTGCDISGLSTEDFGNGAMKLTDFLRELRDSRRYDESFRRSLTWGRHRPLTVGDPKRIIQKFFGDKEHFEPRQVLFEGYRPQDQPSFSHPKAVYAEYVCENVEEPSFVALLRYWDFNALPHETHVTSERKEIANRERAVLNLIHRIDADLYDRGVLRSKSRDREFNMRYWELFDLERTMRRMGEFLQKFDLQLREKIDMSSKLLSRVAQLHRHEIAHRDLGRESVWVDERRSSVVLSAFGCAHFPATESLREMRVRLVAASTRLPEDEEALGVAPGTPYQQDVFLLGALVWLILSPHDLPSPNGVVDFQPSDFEKLGDVPTGLREWFSKSLSWEPQQRWRSAVEMHDAFLAAVRSQASNFDPTVNLTTYERDDPPYLVYRVDEQIKNDRATIYTSGSGVDKVLVKIWSIATRDDVAVTAALRRFFKAAEDLKYARLAWVQDVVDFGICRNDAYLVTRIIDGDSIAEMLGREIDVDEAYAISEQLIEHIEDLHARGISHGDLNPSNVLVERNHDSVAVRLIDIPEYVDPRFAETRTPAYAPAKPSDAFTRDRFAVSKLVEELLQGSGVRAGDEGPAADLLLMIRDSKVAPDPWLTLGPLVSQLASARNRAKAPSCVMLIGTSNVASKTRLLSDDGQYSVTVSARNNVLSIVGSDASLELALDAATFRLISARRRAADTPFLSWAFKNRAFAFEGEVYLYPASSTKPEEVAWLLGQPEVIGALQRLRESPRQAITSPAQTQSTPTIAAPKTTQVMGPLDVETLWRKTIEIEEDDIPEAVVTGPVTYDATNAFYIIPCDFSRLDIDFDPESRPAVFMNGRKIGDVETASMTSTELSIKNLHRNVSPAIGMRLTITSVQDSDNLARRKRAIERILDDGSLIQGLVKYFAPQAEIEPMELEPAEIPDSILDGYRLNDSQKAAFRKLWRFGPVGLLQGPPGTGKTSFIAAFVHHAITSGKVSNVLLLSQSHKAVDNAVERVLRSFGDDHVSLIRVGQVSKVSERVARYHSRAAQNEYREVFDAEVKERIASVARDIGLPPDYVRECFEYWARLRSHQSILSDSGTAEDEDLAVRAQYSAATDFVSKLASILGLSADATVPDVLEALLPALAGKHQVSSPDLIQRFRQLMTLSREWSDALGGDRTLEPFLVRSRQVISGTCVGVGHRALRVDEVPFDLVIIDEAAKCSPGDLAIGMQVAKRVVLVGDHKQLPPYQERAHFKRLVDALGDPIALRRTDFERALASHYGQRVGARLSEQYRMAPDICRLVSECFYKDDGLHTARGPSPEYYNSLPSPFDEELAWVDTSDVGNASREQPRGPSYVNVVEASTIIRLLKLLEVQGRFWEQYDAVDRAEESQAIGVICMYGAQSTYLKREILTSGLTSAFQDRIKIDTVDSYQGRENPIIIVSLVRNNNAGRIGHVQDLRRLNVALSRAMERLVIVGSSAFFQREFPDNTVRGVLQYFEALPQARIISSGSIKRGIERGPLNGAG